MGDTMKGIVTALLILAGMAFAEKPTGNYDFNVHANFYGGMTNSVKVELGTNRDGVCHYSGDIELPSLRGGRCRSIMILHLYSISGGNVEFSCGYDTDINGTVMMMTQRRDGCPDVVAIDQVSGKALWQHYFAMDDNQADYWDDEFHCGFDVNIDKEYWDAHPESHAQVSYRMYYDWANRIPNVPRPRRR